MKKPRSYLLPFSASQTYVVLFLLIFLCSNIAYSQTHTLAKRWDKRFGGTGGDEIGAIIQTRDGGYMLAGSSLSGADGDKTQPAWDSSADYWLVKIDSVGNKLWDKRFGGSGQDVLDAVEQTIDGGYIMGGYSTSGMDGDKTQPCWGYYDYWIVKIDSLGNKQWDKRYGGTDGDIFYTVEQTRDKGYILCGFSNSPISGDKTQDDWDTTGATDDGWVVKIDSLGNKQWDKRYGWTGDDIIASVRQTNDGGYILGGSTTSNIGGDVSQANFDTSANPTSDYWIVKIDSAGVKQWDKRYGTPYDEYIVSLQITEDGGYIFGGAGGPTTTKRGYWLLKTDSLGNNLWDAVFDGGGGIRVFNLVVQTSDKGYLLSGSSGANAGGDKSENNPTLGYQQTWVVKTDSLGNKQWDKTIFTTGDDYGYAIQTNDGEYAIGVLTDAGIGWYKTQPNWDTSDLSNDYWVIKMYDTLVSGINEVGENVNVSVYPNPFATDLAISIQKENLQQATFTLTDMLGRRIFYKQETGLSSNYTKMLDLGYLPDGLYLLEVVVDGECISKRIVKE